MRAIVVLLSVCLGACRTGWHGEARDFRQDMRSFVGAIGEYADMAEPGFLIIPQNGHELLTATGTPEGDPVAAYVGAIHGVGREDLFYGYEAEGVPTPAEVRDPMLAFMDLAEEHGVQVLVADYTADPAEMDDSYARSVTGGYISFAAPSRGLDVIPDYPPTPYGRHTGDVAALDAARNFLYLLNPTGYASRAAYLAALAATDYDLLILDLFYEDTALTAQELGQLRTKAGGGQRLLICYLSIGEAEDYRFYWDPVWTRRRPSWLAEENPQWRGNYKVEYWDPAWQAIVFGSSGAYLDRILAAGFDGAYLDIIDAYEYFETALGL